MLAAAALVAVGAACTPAAPAACAPSGWCKLPIIGVFGDPANSYVNVAGVTDGGDVLFQSRQSVGLTTDIDGDNTVDLFLWHNSNGSFTRFSNGLGYADGSISDDGRWVAYSEFTDPLAPVWGGHTGVIRLRDMRSGRDIGLPWGSDPDRPYRCSEQPAFEPPLIAADGSSVFFTTDCYDQTHTHLWTQASGHTIELPLVGGHDTFSSTQTFRGNDGAGLTVQRDPAFPAPTTVSHFDFATQTLTPATIRQHAVPSESTTDASTWVSGLFDDPDTADLAPFPNVTNVVTGSTTPISVPSGFDTSYVPNFPPSIVISGDGRYLAISDNHSVWVRRLRK